MPEQPMGEPRKPASARTALAIAAAAAAVAATIALVDRVRDAARSLRDGRSAVESASVDLAREDTGLAVARGVLAVTATTEIRDGAIAAGEVWLATEGGVLVHGQDGVHRRTLTWTHGLPTTATTAVVPWRGGVAVGTADGAVVLIDAGDALEVVRPSPPRGPILDLAVAPDRLFVLTPGALVIHDGAGARAFTPPETAGELSAIAVDGLRVAVGTSTGHVLVGDTDRLVVDPTEGDGERVTALAWGGDVLWVGRPFGLDRRDPDGAVQSVRADVSVSALLVDAAGQLHVGTVDSGVIVTSPDGAERRVGGASRVHRLRSLDGGIVALGGRAWRVDDAAPWVEAPPRGLPRAHVTAIARFDDEVWIATAGGGIDVRDVDGRPLRRLRDPAWARRLVSRPDRHDLLAVGRGRTARAVGRDGDRAVGVPVDLPGDDVLDAAWLTGALALATDGGVTLVGSDGGARVVTREDGLESRRATAVAWGTGGRLWVGTPAGIAVLTAEGDVERYLPAGVITALVAAGDGSMWAGTKDRGVVRVAPDGTLVPVGPDGVGVSAGALAVDGTRLFVGTTARGLLLYDPAARGWQAVALPLGSRAITAIALDETHLWVGTDQGAVRLERSVVEAALAPPPRS